MHLLHTLNGEMGRAERIEALLAVEREARDLFESAAQLSVDPSERALFERLASRQGETLHELEAEEERLEAEAFVQRAIGC